MRQFFWLLLLICLPLQSFALQGSQLLSAGIAHELQHDHGIQHHHDDDGSIHYDDSDDSVQHAIDHSASTHSAWSPAPYMPAMLNDAPCTFIVVEPIQFPPDSHLDCPHRPPAPSLG